VEFDLDEIRAPQEDISGAGYPPAMLGVPWWWVEQAGRIGGPCLRVAMAILEQSARTGRKRITVSPTCCQRFGIDRRVRNRAIPLLVEAGLIEVLGGGQGRSPEVCIKVTALK
jgi:hypothetical protein